jgi:hypothetical protein
MPYKIDQHQIEGVLRLAAPDRYRHFLKRVADWQELWALKAIDGFVEIADDNGNEGIPFWPHPRYAELHAIGEWSGYQPTRIALSDFIQTWLTGMEKDGAKVIVFPTPEMRGLGLDPAQFGNDLMRELSQYE